MKRDLYIPMYTKRDLRVWKCVYEKTSIRIYQYEKGPMCLEGSYFVLLQSVRVYIYRSLFIYIGICRSLFIQVYAGLFAIFMKRDLCICESPTSSSHLVCGIFMGGKRPMKRDLHMPIYMKITCA